MSTATGLQMVGKVPDMELKVISSYSILRLMASWTMSGWVSELLSRLQCFTKFMSVYYKSQVHFTRMSHVLQGYLIVTGTIIQSSQCPCEAWSHAEDGHGPQHIIHKTTITTDNSSPPSATYMHQWIGSALVQIMACRLFSAKPLSKPVLGYCQLDPYEQT